MTLTVPFGRVKGGKRARSGTALVGAGLLALGSCLYGCGSDDTARWQDAPNAQQFFGSSAVQQALGEEAVDKLSLNCEELLPAARAGLKDPGSPEVRVLIDTCSRQRLGFGGELRCADGMLQVRCL